jgi:hypothetical protein
MKKLIEYSLHRRTLSLLKIPNEIVQDWALIVHVFALKQGKDFKDVSLALPSIAIVHRIHH